LRHRARVTHRFRQLRLISIWPITFRDEALTTDVRQPASMFVINHRLDFTIYYVMDLSPNLDNRLVSTSRIGCFMNTYILSFAGENTYKTIECESLSDARNQAVKYLASYLIDHPGFANDGHWRVNVEDEAHNELFHVIVATVTSRHAKQLNQSAEL
jgi:hypothetical protein